VRAPTLWRQAGTDLTVIGPSGPAHGFATAKGVKAVIPKLYSMIAHDVGAALAGATRREWRGEPGETFHAKGAWLFDRLGSRRPAAAATLVCSSNWNQRSLERDVELGLTLVSRHAGLRRQLRSEHDALARAAPVVDPAAPPPPSPLWLRLVRRAANSLL